MRLRDRFHLILLVSIVIFCLGCESPEMETADDLPFHRFEQPPNIIWIMADDLGYGDLGAYGQEQIQTPRLDQMASEGLRFTQFYSGHTVCAPARSSLMTGQHTGKTRVRGNFSSVTNNRIPLEPDDITVAEILRQAGFKTALIGKWGLGEPQTTGLPNLKGFDYFWGFLNQRRAHTYHPEWVWRNDTRVVLDQHPERVEFSQDFAVGNHEHYSHDLDIQEAEWFIRANRERPFFLYLALQIPHAELIVPDDSLEDYLDEEGNSIFEEHPFAGSGTYRAQEKPNAVYAAMVTRMDRDVGALLDLLKQLNIHENTLVFFTSDNGPHSEGGYDPDFFNSNGPLRGIKRDLYEGGIRVPMIVWMPGTVPAGEISDQVWAMWDLMPTAAEIAGVDIPDQTNGISMVNALLNQPQDDPEYLYWEFHEGVFSQAVRFGDWKAIRTDYGNEIELYDLSTDIGETENLANEYPDIVEKADHLFQSSRTPTEHWPTELDSK
jgi:arylsulfatase A-like enzyme